MPNVGLTREHVKERRADLDRQLSEARQKLAAAQRDQQSAQQLIQAIDGAIQENNYYDGLISEQERAPNAE